ncbi:MAG: glycosyltransferase family 4 protein [Patescibacteria group bacterium]|nr:glycosyltransferase family 4 protein [Patescibacteria group bacterium]
MKILYVVTKSNWGGAQRHVYDLSTAMKAAGNEVWVALGGDGILKQKLEQAGIYTFSIASMGRDISVGKDAGSFRALSRIIKDKRPDVLHLHSPKAAGLGSLAGRLRRVKLIVTTVHGWSFNESRPFHQRAAIALFSWATVLLSHKTIVLSKREYSQGLYFPFARARMRLIPLGIRPPVFMSIDGARQFVARAIGMSSADLGGRFLIVNLAELHRNKGQSYLIEAMAAVAGAHPGALCVIISDGEEKAALAKLIAEKGLEGRVFLAGYVDEATQYLKAFNLMVMSSVKEGLPYTILEAGTAGLPVVSTAVGGIPEAIEDMRSGILVQPRNSHELAHAISFMIEHPDDRRRYGAALKEKVQRDFSLENMVAKVKEVYGSEV